MSKSTQQCLTDLLNDSAVMKVNIELLANSVNSVISLMRIVSAQLDKIYKLKSSDQVDQVQKSTSILTKTDLDTKLMEFDKVLNVLLSEKKDLVPIS